MGHTVNSLAKRVQKLEVRLAELEDAVDELVESQTAQTRSKGPDREWVIFVDPEEFVPLKENGFLCETNGCNNETWHEENKEYNEGDDEEQGSMAHWEFVGDYTSDLPEGVFIPCYICSECMQAVLEDRRPE